MSAPICEMCAAPVAPEDYCDGCREDPEEYAPRHTACCERAEDAATGQVVP